MTRRMLLLSAAPALALQVERSRTGVGPLKIVKVEAFVLRAEPV